MSSLVTRVALVCLTIHVASSTFAMLQSMHLKPPAANLNNKLGRVGNQHVLFNKPQTLALPKPVHRPAGPILAQHQQPNVQKTNQHSNAANLRGSNRLQKLNKNSASIASTAPKTPNGVAYIEHNVRMRKLLAQIEARHNIKVLYAAESGKHEWSLVSSDEPEHHVRFVYVFNNNSTNTTNVDSRTPLVEKSQDGNVHLIGHELRPFMLMVNDVQPTAVVEMFYSSRVYKEFAPFGEAVRTEVIERPSRFPRLLGAYRDEARRLVDKLRYDVREPGVVELDTYACAVRACAMYQWLVLHYDTPYLEDDQAPYWSRFIELDVTRVLDDLRSYASVAEFHTLVRDESVYAAVESLIESRLLAMGDSELCERVTRVDEWMKAVVEQRFGFMLESEEARVQHYETVGRLYETFASNV